MADDEDDETYKKRLAAEIATYYSKNHKKKKVDIYSKAPLFEVKKVISIRSLMIYIQTLIIPFCATALWLLLPIDSYPTFCLVVAIYQFFSLLTWLTFFDLTLPGCPRTLIAIFSAFFVSCMIAWFTLTYNGHDLHDQKLIYTILSALELVCVIVCYSSHLLIAKINSWYHELKKKRRQHTRRKNQNPLDQPFLNLNDGGEEGEAMEEYHGRTKRSGSVKISRPVFDIDDVPVIDEYTAQHQPVEEVDIPPSPQVKRLSRKDITLKGFVKEKISSFDRVLQQEREKEKERERENRNEKEKVENEKEIDDENDDDDGDDVEEGTRVTKEEQEKKKKKVNAGRWQTKDKHCSRFVYNLLCYVPYIDDEVLAESSIKTPLTWSALIWASIYRVAFFGIWVWLQIITELFVRYKVFTTRASLIGILVLYHTIRVICFQIMLVLNKKLPPIAEIRFFAQFAVPFLFYIYYRYLFLVISDWYVVLAANLVITLWQVILYAGQMTGWFYYFRFIWLPRKLDQWQRALSCFFCFFCNRLRRFEQLPQQQQQQQAQHTQPSAAEDGFTYETHLTEMAVEYYYDEVAEYISLIASFLYFVEVRYYWNSDVFPSVSRLSDDVYEQIMWQYLFSFGCELLGDVFIRWLVHVLFKVNISNIGRNLTVLNYRTRFLFALFVAKFLADANYSLIELHLS